MTIRMSIFARKPSLTEEDFRSYWRDIHAPIALKIPTLARYEQNHVLPPSKINARSMLGPVDGVCKLWFESALSMQKALSPDIVQALREDEEKFIQALRTFVVDQNIVLPPPDHQPAGLLKLLVLVIRRPELDGAAFDHAWRGQYSERMLSMPGVCGYVQNFVVARTANRQAVSYEQLPIDCVDEVWVDISRDPQEGRSLASWEGRLRSIALEFAGTLELLRVEVHAP